MHTRRLTNKPYRSPLTLALFSGTLLIVLAGGAQAQMTRTRPQPTSRTDSGDPAPSHSTGTTETPSPRSSADSASAVGRSGNAPAPGGKPNFKVLFPTAKSGGVGPGVSKGHAPGMIVFDDPFDDAALRNATADAKSDSDAQTDSDSKDAKGGGKRKERPSSADTASYARYKQSHEGGVVSKPAQVPTDRCPIYWPYDYLSPFWGYSVDQLIWWPRDIYSAWPDASVIWPYPDSGVLGWPNYDTPSDAPTDLPRDDPAPNYRIGEKTKPRRPVDLQPALDAIQRAFQEEHPVLLAFHLQREALLNLSTPGEAPGRVKSERLLDRLADLFAKRDTIALEFEAQETLAADQFAVTAWHTYRDDAGTVYRRRVHFVLETRDDKPILTAFEID
jgi:hypothetical protein